MTDATTSATATIIQAAEHIVIDEATAVVKQLSTKNAADIKSIVNGVAKETVAASDDSVSTILQNVEDGAIVIGKEIVKGAEAVIDAVEKHPELIAEGALALGIGVASLVQPELIVGSVALVGKMAADATKETIDEIVVESGNSIVKGIAKEVTDETAELAAQDAAEKAKAAALEAAKDGPKAGVEATVAITSTGTTQSEITTTDGSKPGEEAGKMVKTTVAGDATAVVREVTPGDAPGPIIASETVQTSATATTETKDDSKAVTTSGPSIVLTTNDLTGEQKAAVQQGSTTAVVGTSKDAAPVSVASVDVKELAKEVAREMSELEAAKLAQPGEKTLESSVSADTSLNKSLKAAAAKLEADIKNSEAKNEAEASASLKLRLEKLKNAKVQHEKANTSVPADAPKSESVVTGELPILMQLGLVHPDEVDFKEEKEPNAEASTNKSDPTSVQESDSTTPSKEVLEEKATAGATTPEVTEEATPSLSNNLTPEVPTEDLKEVELTEPSAQTPITIRTSEDTPKSNPITVAIPNQQSTPKTIPSPSSSSTTSDAAAHLATQAAVKEAHAKIADLHTSNELLHKKLDTMQEALLAITKALAEHPNPPPALTPSQSTEQTTESEPIATENNQLVLASATPTTAAVEGVNKRMSVFASIGWLFGAGSGSKSGKKHQRGKSVATSTPATVGGEGVVG